MKAMLNPRSVINKHTDGTKHFQKKYPGITRYLGVMAL
jgi:hypothetical protein